jgi:type I restriction enzyme S subunit
MKKEYLKKLGKISFVPNGWQITTVGQACKIRNDLRKPISVDERSDMQGQYPYYGPTGILDFIDHHRIDGKYALIGEDGDHYLKPLEKPQTILAEGQFNVNNHAHIIQGTSKCMTEWFYIYFHNRDITHMLSRQGANRYKLNKQTLNSLPILIPSRNEQAEIYNIFNSCEAAIEKTEALIDAKERQLGWLQKSVLDDDFKSYGGHLSDYAGIMKQQKIEEVGDLKPLTVKLHCKGIEANERDVQITLSKKGRPYFQRFSGEFLIGRQNFHNGGFGIVPKQLDGFIASSAITTLEIDPAKLDPKYLFYFFSRKDYYLRIGHIMDGTGQKELSDKQIMKLPVSIPSIDKQKEVVALLDTAQQEITLLKKLVDQYRTQKRGLMQKLLSGEWHIKNKEVAA